MKKQFTFILLGTACLSAVTGFSQEERKIQPCNTYAAMEEYFNIDPGAREKSEAFDRMFAEKYRQAQENGVTHKSASAPPIYTVPVVFHVLHLGGNENKSDQICINALAKVNEDFARLGNDVNTIAQPFQGRYIDSEIKFKLVHKDPSGNCTNGINHIYTSKTKWKQADLSYYNNILWDNGNYRCLNIVIVAEIVPQTTVVGGGVIVGYTRKPGSTYSAIDAIVYDGDFLGGSDARSLSHEIGHWLNLDHTFGNTNNPGVVCGDDGLYDTPPTKGNFSSCPSSASGNACSTSGNTVYTAGQQNTENIMDYSSCPKNFTSDQTTTMRTALTSATNRVNHWTANNLTNTDVNSAGVCPPIADFYSINDSYTTCANSSLTFKEQSFNGQVTSYAWSVSNGASASSPSANLTSITFPVIGTTNVSLTVSNMQGSHTKVKTVTVLDGTPGIVAPTFESFENGLPSEWAIINADPNSVTWAHSYDAARDGVASFFIEGAQAGGNQVDILETPIIDVAANQNKTFEFGLSYAQKVAGHNDILKVQGSMDCGGSWIDIVTLSANQMQLGSGGITSNSFVPYLPEEWRTFTVSAYPPWVQFHNSPNVKLRFTFTEAAAGSGNNIFIDAMNIFSATTGINQLTKDYRYSLLPNPSRGEITVGFKLDDVSEVKISVTDMLGRKVLNDYNEHAVPGEHSVHLNTAAILQQGVYFVNFSVNGTTMTKKMIIH